MARIHARDLDPVAWAINYLHLHLPAGPGIGDERHGASLPYISVRGNGGIGRRPLTATAGLGINVWAETESEAQDLALEVRSWLLYADHAWDCLAAACTLPAKVEDSSGAARRYLSAELTLNQLAGDNHDT